MYHSTEYVLLFPIREWLVKQWLLAKKKNILTWWGRCTWILIGRRVSPLILVWFTLLVEEITTTGVRLDWGLTIWHAVTRFWYRSLNKGMFKRDWNGQYSDPGVKAQSHICIINKDEQTPPVHFHYIQAMGWIFASRRVQLLVNFDLRTLPRLLACSWVTVPLWLFFKIPTLWMSEQQLQGEVRDPPLRHIC